MPQGRRVRRLEAPDSRGSRSIRVLQEKSGTVLKLEAFRSTLRLTDGREQAKRGRMDADVRTSEDQLEIGSVKILKNFTGDGWYASVVLSVAAADGSRARGWVHVHPRGSKWVVDDWDSEPADSNLFESVIHAESATILDAVRAKMAAENGVPGVSMP
jgi:hypothetical protein